MCGKEAWCTSTGFFSLLVPIPLHPLLGLQKLLSGQINKSTEAGVCHMHASCHQMDILPKNVTCSSAVDPQFDQKVLHPY